MSSLKHFPIEMLTQISLQALQRCVTLEHLQTHTNLASAHGLVTGPSLVSTLDTIIKQCSGSGQSYVN